MTLSDFICSRYWPFNAPHRLGVSWRLSAAVGFKRHTGEAPDEPVRRIYSCDTGSARYLDERLELVPTQLRAIIVRRPKYACRACQDVVV